MSFFKFLSTVITYIALTAFTFATEISENDDTQELVKKFHTFTSFLASGSSSPEACINYVTRKSKRSKTVKAYGIGLDKIGLYKSGKIIGRKRVINFLDQQKPDEYKLQITDIIFDIKNVKFDLNGNVLDSNSIIEKLSKNEKIIHSKIAIYTFNSRAELTSSSDNLLSAKAINYTYSPPIPFCEKGITVHETISDKTYSIEKNQFVVGESTIKVVQENKHIDGFWHYKVYLFDEFEKDNIGDQVSYRVEAFDEVNGWTNGYSDSRSEFQIMVVKEEVSSLAE